MRDTSRRGKEKGKRGLVGPKQRYGSVFIGGEEGSGSANEGGEN